MQILIGIIIVVSFAIFSFSTSSKLIDESISNKSEYEQKS